MKVTPVIISYKSTIKLEKCLEQFAKNIKCVVVENSNDQKKFKYLINKYKKINIIFNKKNYGYAKASNIGFKHVDTQFALLLSPDVIINHNQIKKIEKKIKNLKKDFTLASPIYDDLINFKNNKFFLKEKFKKISEVNFIKGCAMIINLNKFKDNKVFDENIFFFFEEIDLCKRIKEKKEKIYVFNDIKIEHIGADSTNVPTNKYINFRNWNYYWSKFYFYKKHKGLLYSIIIHIFTLCKFLLFALCYYFFSRNKYEFYKYRLMGLVSSMLNVKSSESKHILNSK